MLLGAAEAMDYEQTFTHPLECLQIELVNGFRGDELHRWALNRLGRVNLL